MTPDPVVAVQHPVIEGATFPEMLQVWCSACGEVTDWEMAEGPRAAAAPGARARRRGPRRAGCRRGVGAVSAPACPTCGATDWLVPAAVEVEVRVLGGRAAGVVVTEPHVVDGEGDPRCRQCGALLLDWGAAQHDDAEWQRHHDERRPAWDELRHLVPTLTLPPPAQWGLR